MQVRVMAACMESQSFIRSAQSRPRDGRGVSDVYEQQFISLIYYKLHSINAVGVDRLSRGQPAQLKTKPICARAV